MRVVQFAGAALAVAMLTAPAAMAKASHTVIVGLSPATDCYRATLDDRRDQGSLDTCTLALDDDFLPYDVRAATLVNRSVLHLRRHENRSALTDATVAISLGALNSTQAARAYFYRAAANEDLGDARAAYGDYRQAAALAPSWDAPRLELARFQVR